MAPNPLGVIVFGVVLLTGALYPTFIHDFLFITLGINRKIQPISDFPYQCRKITGAGLQACEDMWFSERTRTLFLACADSIGRREWSPTAGRFNVSGRGLKDTIIALNVDEPRGDSFEYRALEFANFPGVNGDRRMHPVGMSGLDREDHVELYLVNIAPSVNTTTGEFLENAEVGANSTIEHFSVNVRDKEEKHIQTFLDQQIATPNRVAPLADGSFYLTNDHGQNKIGFRHTIAAFIYEGDISFCGKDGCKQITRGHQFPNGLMLGQDGLLYVPSAHMGSIQVYQPQADGGLEKVDFIDIDYPIDNLSQDVNGDIYAAALPKLWNALAASNDPFHAVLPSTVFRIHKNQMGAYEVEKVLEDAKGEVLPITTTAVHDAKTGRIFASSVISPFITVCDPRNGDVEFKVAEEDSGHSEL